MKYKAYVLKDETFDPYYKVKFFFEGESTIIENGCAEIIRKPPRPDIRFDTSTEEKLSANDRCMLELELLNTIMNHLFSTRKAKMFGIRMKDRS